MAGVVARPAEGHSRNRRAAGRATVAGHDRGGVVVRVIRFGHQARVAVDGLAHVRIEGVEGTEGRTLVARPPEIGDAGGRIDIPKDRFPCLLYTSPSPRDGLLSR